MRFACDAEEDVKCYEAKTSGSFAEKCLTA
jgi:hypothetical protein